MEPELARLIGDVKCFTLSSALLAAFELELFPRLHGGGASRPALCRELNLKENIAFPFLDVLIANGYLSETDDGVELTQLSRSALPTFLELQSWASEMSLTFASLAELPELLRTGDTTTTPLSLFWSYKSHPGSLAALSRDQTTHYSRLMDASGSDLYQLLADTWDFDRYARVVDLGGGFGGLGLTLARATESACFVVADLPSVMEGVTEEARARGLAARVSAIGIDFLRDPLPSDADAYVLCRVLHDWDDDSAVGLLQNIGRSLKQGAEVVVVENLAPEGPTAEDPSSAATALMLALLGGRRRSASDIRALCHSADLEVKEVRPLGRSRLHLLVLGEGLRS